MSKSGKVGFSWRKEMPRFSAVTVRIQWLLSQNAVRRLPDRFEHVRHRFGTAWPAPTEAATAMVASYTTENNTPPLNCKRAGDCPRFLKHHKDQESAHVSCARLQLRQPALSSPHCSCSLAAYTAVLDAAHHEGVVAMAIMACTVWVCTMVYVYVCALFYAIPPNLMPRDDCSCRKCSMEVHGRHGYSGHV